jgi:hypothetical protein
VFFGPVSDVVSIDMLLIVTGIIVSLLCIPMITSKTLLEAGKSPSA